MGSLDVDLLFTNIFLEKTINICTNLLYNNDVIEGINKFEFKNLLSLATQESYFIFNDVLYKQKDGVAMGSPLGPTMTNVLSFYEVKWLEQCPKEFKPVFYRRYVDDIFVLFESVEHLSKFCDYFNTCYPNMYFSFAQEKNGKLSFLDVEVSREKGKFVTTVYRSLHLVVCTPISIVSCKRYANLVWFILFVVSKFGLIGQSFMINLAF